MIDYAQSLNAAQYAAATTQEPSVLVVAGAGSGKTRTIVYRLAWLAQQGVDPSTMLLLTFTRKAAREMLDRADALLGQNLIGIHGGTFHSFAFQTLQKWHTSWRPAQPFSLMDQGDINDAIKQCRANLHLGQGDRSFPKTQTIAAILSKARNKELPIETVLQHDNYHLLSYAEDLKALGEEYQRFRREKGLMDYDDLLFDLEELLVTNSRARQSINAYFSHILVDEYQDTNLVQARIVRALAMDAQGNQCTSVMAVGDEAQSIYAFRGATVRNILDFPKTFPNTKLIPLEENFRSTQYILDVANGVLSYSSESFKKVLFSQKGNGEPVHLFKPRDDEEQAKRVYAEICKLLKRYPPEEIAVLFRSGYHSYQIEMLLNRHGLPYNKYGGIKYMEAAHVKDCVAYAKFLLNPLDPFAFARLASMHERIGPKTQEKLYGLLRDGSTGAFEKALKKHHTFAEQLNFVDALREQSREPHVLFGAIVEHYLPIMQQRYAEDWPQRKQGLDEILHIAQKYTDLEDFVADLILENGKEDDRNKHGRIVLSTIHSAKGLEWDAVLLIDLVEGRFPSHHALEHEEDLEEERRLMYVATTRARKHLLLFAPKNIYSRQDFCAISASPSPFICEVAGILDKQMKNEQERKNVMLDFDDEDELDEDELDEDFEEEIPQKRLTSLKETLAHLPKTKTVLTKNHHSTKVSAPKTAAKKTVKSASSQPSVSAICTHPIFGQGKILRLVNKEEAEVQFKRFGTKIMRLKFLTFEEK